MPVDDADAIEITDRLTARRAADLFIQFPKTRSWLALHELGLPTLPGIIVRRWSDEASVVVHQFFSRRNFDQVLLRSDKAPETPPYPRGGFLVDLRHVAAEVELFLRAGRIVWLLEPASPYSDRYSVNASVVDESVQYEIVGPGFDASDLKRGDISPHERLEVSIWDRVSRQSIRHHFTVTPNSYVNSRRRRMEKIGEFLQATGRQRSDMPPTQAARRELASLKQTLLLTATEYSPIALRHLTRIHEACISLAVNLPEIGLPERPFIVSASFLGDEMRLVFWDIVWPQSKYSL
jgi:hypothetical protein